MNNYIEADVHLIATDKPSNLTIALHYNNRLRQVHNNYECKKEDELFQHLYFTDNSEIKEPCWVIMTPTIGDKKLLYIENILENPKYFDMRGGYALDRNICKKIIATNNSDLWDKEINNIKLMSSPGDKGTTSITKGISKILQSFIDDYIEKYNAGTPIIKVRLENEHYFCVNGQLFNTWNDRAEFMERIDNIDAQSINEYDKLKLNTDGSVIVVKEQEKLYTREETLNILLKAKTFMDSMSLPLKKDLIEWFNKNYPNE